MHAAHFTATGKRRDQSRLQSIPRVSSARYAGVVDQNVHPAHRRQYPFGQFRSRSRHRQIGFQYYGIVVIVNYSVTMLPVAIRAMREALGEMAERKHPYHRLLDSGGCCPPFYWCS